MIHAWLQSYIAHFVPLMFKQVSQAAHSEAEGSQSSFLAADIRAMNTSAQCGVSRPAPMQPPYPVSSCSVDDIKASIGMTVNVRLLTVAYRQL